MSRLTPPRPWQPLTDPQWQALLPHVMPRSPQGRRVPDLRHRMDAIFRLALTPGHPWRMLPPEYGKPDTVSRTFRRLTHNGLWHALLTTLHDAPPTTPCAGSSTPSSAPRAAPPASAACPSCSSSAASACEPP
jgi:transposase